MASETAPSGALHAAYRYLRLVFIGGCALWIVLWFTPSVEISVRGTGRTLSVSTLDLARLSFQVDRTGSWIFMFLVFCATLAFAILASAYPKRWVFIAGGGYAVFTLVLALFTRPAPPEGTRILFLPQLLNYLALAMVLAGFWVRPPGAAMARAGTPSAVAHEPPGVP